MPDGSAPTLRTLSALEAKAHVAVLELVARRQRFPGTYFRGGRRISNGVADHGLLRQFNNLLPLFSARCNCGRVLVSTPLTGLTHYRCTCGVSFVEAT